MNPAIFLPTHANLLTQLKLQEEVNSKVNPDWLNAKQNWNLAIMMEQVEIIDHIGWKWWKKQDAVDNSAIKMELGDIWHFWLSSQIERYQALGFAELANKILEDLGEWSAGNDLVNTSHWNNSYAILRMESAIIHTLSSQFSLKIFMECMDYYALSWLELHEVFVTKNVLNIFRQDNGYKSGSYLKLWWGEEDNSHAMKILDAAREREIPIQELPNFIQENLYFLYQSLLESYEVSISV